MNVYAIRGFLTRNIYKLLLRPVIFLWPAETAHNKLKEFGLKIAKKRLGRMLLKSLFYFEHKILNTQVDGVKYKNPIGLSAGFDKDGELTGVYPLLGFGFAELGSFTGDICAGNPGVGRRLFRLVKSKSILVWYGLNNMGSKIISKKLKNQIFTIPIGISAAKSNQVMDYDIEISILDYLKTINAFRDIGNYYTINISCPNTIDGEPFANKDNLHKLLSRLDDVKQDEKPVYVKIAADLDYAQMDEIVQCCMNHQVNGFVLTNLTKPALNNEYIKEELTFDKGALSGLPVQRISTNAIRHIYQKSKGKMTIIGVGGIFNADDAYEKITSGANLVQLITGMIFEGPQVIGEINRGLVKLLEKDGFTSIEEAVGSRNPLK
jgi:dihydroorotate dehydrogenase